MNILFFTQISPFPVTRGERIRSYGLLKALSNSGHTVHAIIGNEDKISINDFSIKNVIFYEQSPKVFRKVDNLFGVSYFKKDNNLIDVFDNILLKSSIKLAFLDYAFIGQYIKYFKNQGIPVIYGTHNSQSNLSWQKPVEGIFKKVIKFQRKLFQNFHERYYFNRADIIIVVSEKDKDFHSNFVSLKKLIVIPNFLDENKYLNNYLKEDYFVMTANFSAYMNAEGLKWFITNVWDEELDAKIRFKVVGQNSIQALSQIEASKKFLNIEAVGSVKEIYPYIGKAQGVIVPLLQGSGSRLKCLEAMALKTTIISTNKGVEGLNSEGFYVCNTPEEFKSVLLNFEVNDIKADIAYVDFLENYSLKSAVYSMNATIQRAIRG